MNSMGFVARLAVGLVAVGVLGALFSLVFGAFSSPAAIVVTLLVVAVVAAMVRAGRDAAGSTASRYW